ncbi:Os01g0868301 [Oryza sativa Japonica Group]|uniref:Os01g0868301 protein n=1 Tax=Oryza sativa subsp. japonica TaxID=39947 RepID=A0A0P0VAW5_ORYSJ|nr:hypothetical protein EE612_007031 [Oryza sativa]BAS75407.1 Os01g0868301 [Oryza sativa Japonica Group]
MHRILAEETNRKKYRYLSNALPYPGAMMVKPFHAIVANGTVRTPRRPKNHASFTVLDLHRHPIYHNIFYTRED